MEVNALGGVHYALGSLFEFELRLDQVDQLVDCLQVDPLQVQII